MKKRGRVARAMPTAMRVAGNKEGNGDGNRNSGNINDDGATRAVATATMWAMATGTRVADDK